MSLQACEAAGRVDRPAVTSGAGEPWTLSRVVATVLVAALGLFLGAILGFVAGIMTGYIVIQC
jgi:ABC-type amino acid transport system permease subunit